MAEVELPEVEELEERKKEGGFTKRVALVTAMYAVFLAITSLGGNNATKEMMLAQQQASDQWSFYQAKALRQNLYKVQREVLEANLSERCDTIKEESRHKYGRLLAELSNEEERYGTEKNKIQDEAKKLEAERDLNMKKDPYFDYAEVLLQIAIVLSSISILATSRPVFGISVVSAVIGVLLSLNGYLLVIK